MDSVRRVAHQCRRWARHRRVRAGSGLGVRAERRDIAAGAGDIGSERRDLRPKRRSVPAERGSVGTERGSFGARRQRVHTERERLHTERQRVRAERARHGNHGHRRTSRQRQPADELSQRQHAGVWRRIAVLHDPVLGRRGRIVRVRLRHGVGRRRAHRPDIGRRHRWAASRAHLACRSQPRPPTADRRKLGRRWGGDGWCGDWQRSGGAGLTGSAARGFPVTLGDA